MTGKHFINGVEDPVERGLKWLLRQDQSLRLIESQKGKMIDNRGSVRRSMLNPYTVQSSIEHNQIIPKSFFSLEEVRGMSRPTLAILEKVYSISLLPAKYLPHLQLLKYLLD